MIERVKHPIRLVVTERVAATVARQTADRLRGKPRFNLGVGTGATLEAVYPHFIETVRQEQIDLSQASLFGLDEYWGGSRPFSYAAILEEGLFKPLGLRADQIHLLYWGTNYPQLACGLFEREIIDAGGIDFQWLGLGMTGHLGFNEPGSPFASITRRIFLAERTRISNSRFRMTEEDRRTLSLERDEKGEIEDPHDKAKNWGPYQTNYFNQEVLHRVPEQAMTQGLSTILRARELFLLATGKRKAAPIARLFNEEPNENFPATTLRFHPHATVFTDIDAAAELPVPYRQVGIYSL